MLSGGFQTDMSQNISKKTVTAAKHVPQSLEDRIIKMNNNNNNNNNNKELDVKIKLLFPIF